MSAFIVDRKHIELLVRAALCCRGSNYPFKYGSDGRQPVGYDNAGDVAQMLWDENIKSVHFRYPNEPVEDLPGTIGENYVFGDFPEVFRPIGLHGNVDNLVRVFKAIECYEYQSCEHPEWETSEAKSFCDNLRHSLISRLPGYEDASWAISAQ